MLDPYGVRVALRNGKEMKDFLTHKERKSAKKMMQHRMRVSKRRQEMKNFFSDKIKKDRMREAKRDKELMGYMRAVPMKELGRVKLMDHMMRVSKRKWRMRSREVGVGADWFPLMSRDQSRHHLTMAGKRKEKKEKMDQRPRIARDAGAGWSHVMIRMSKRRIQDYDNRNQDWMRSSKRENHKQLASRIGK